MDIDIKFNLAAISGIRSIETDDGKQPKIGDSWLSSQDEQKIPEKM